MPDSSAIDQALVDKLLADAPLRALMPDGVFMDEAEASLVDGRASTQFVIVSLVAEHDAPMFGGRAYEDGLYLVKAVELSTSVPRNIRAAAARIDAILDDGTLEIEGYGLMVMQREERIRHKEPDPQDPASIRWYHRGGRYQVMASAPAVPYVPPVVVIDGGAPDTVFLTALDGGGI